MYEKNNDILCNANSADFPQKVEGFSYIKHQSALHHSTADKAYPCNGGNVSGASFSAKINVKYIANGSRNELLAVAFVATVRAYEHRNGARCSYTVNAIHELTGVHAQTICKRVATLKRMGLAIEDNGKIRLLSVKSKHSGHNVQLGIEIGRKTLKNAEKAVLQERFITKLHQMNYYRNAISRYKDFSKQPEVQNDARRVQETQPMVKVALQN